MYPWTDTAATWYARLVNGRGEVYGLARRLVDGGSVQYDTWNGTDWQPTYEGAGYFTGAGGITDAEPIDADEAARLLASLTAPGPLPLAPDAPDLGRFVAREGDLRQER